MSVNDPEEIAQELREFAEEYSDPTDELMRDAADTIEAQSKLIEELREAVIDLRDVYTKGVLHMMSGGRDDERLIRAINLANERMDAALSKASPHSEKVE